MATNNSINAPLGALTRTNDANVTLTLGGTPTTSLLRDVSLTLGWNGVLSPNRGGIGLSTSVKGDILYADVDNSWATLAGNTTTTKKFLTQTGTGTISAAPSWGTIAAADITTGATATAVFYAGASGVLSSDVSKFSWDDTNGRLSVNTTSTVTSVNVNGVVSIFDSGTKTLNSGVATEQQGTIIEIGSNDGVDNRFGGTYTSASPGGFFRTDARAGNNLFSWYGRAAAVTGSATQLAFITALGSFGLGNAAVTTSATDGYPYLPTCPGTPTGTPTTFTGLSPFVLDSTNKLLYFYQSGWLNAGDRTALTSGSIPFAASGAYSQDNTNFFWDNTNHRLGVGTPTPGYRLEVSGVVKCTSNFLAVAFAPPDAQGTWIGWNRGGAGSSGATCFANQLGTGGGGWEWVAYNNSNVATNVAMTLTQGGNLAVSGTLSKGGGTFKIDHPIDPLNKFLYHSFAESDVMLNIYNGIIELDQNGDAIVVLPEWLIVINKDFRYQLTCVGGYSNIYISQEIINGNFKISGGYLGLKVCWQLLGTRCDNFALANPIIVECEKTGNEIGKYIHPEVIH